MCDIVFYTDICYVDIVQLQISDTDINRYNTNIYGREIEHIMANLCCNVPHYAVSTN